MAGSYAHVVDQAGRLLSPAALRDVLDTDGDVYEAIEEMYSMIWYLAATRQAGTTMIPMPAAVMVEQARDNSLSGMSVSPGLAADYEQED